MEASGKNRVRLSDLPAEVKLTPDKPDVIAIMAA
jgi:hypothetical protein